MTGAEPVLVREVCDCIRARVQPSRHGLDVLFAGSTPEEDVWAACSQFPAPGQSRLVLVHGAGQLAQAPQMGQLLESVRTMAGVHVVFTGEAGEEFLGLLQHSSAGQVVRCSFASDGEKACRDKEAWVRERLGSQELASEVLELVDWDFSAAAVVCDKVRRCGLSTAYARHLAAWHGVPPFADSLVLGERKAALRAAAVLGPEDIGAVVGQLAARLGVMSALYWALQDSASGQALHKAAPDVPAFLVKRFRKAAPSYGPQRVREQRELLDIADSAYRSGAREGILEVLCAGW